MKKAVILAAGKGTRMGSLTESLPKPMLEVHGKPILRHIVDGLRRAGLRDILIVTGHQAEVIEAYFQDGSSLQTRIQYARQREQNGTGKAPELAVPFVGKDPFLLTYGDILVHPDVYPQMLARFQEGPFSGVLTAKRGEEVGKGGILVFNSEFCLDLLVEKPTDADLDQLRRSGKLLPGAPVWYNAGIYIFTPALFRYTRNLKKSPRGEYELTDAIQAMNRDRYRLAGMEIQGPWADVRDPAVLAALSRQIPPAP